MALVLEISEQSYNEVTHVAKFNDNTGYYDVTSNPGGYGTPNADREDLALIISTTYIDGVETVSWDDPLGDFDHYAPFVVDGAYDVRLCSTEYEAGAYDVSLMSEGRVFYSVVDDKLYKVVVVDSVNTLEETTDLVDNAIESTSLLNYLVTSFNEEKAMDIFCESCNCGGLRDEYSHVRSGIDAIQCHFDQGSYSKVNTLVPFINKINI